MESRSDPPLSRDRRKLLLALGFGAINLAVLRGLKAAPERPPTKPTGSASVGVGRLEEVLGDEVNPFAPRYPATLDPDLPALDDGHLFDLVISGGRVIDPESGFDGLANVGIDDHRIMEISPLKLRGRDMIDARGRVVCPGFIDLLSYEPNDFGVWLKLADGVTTNLAMHGVSNYSEPFFNRYRSLSPIHYGGAFSHHVMRGYDLGVDIREPLDGPQLIEMERLVRKNLDHGLAGIAFSPEYSPGTSTQEMEVLARLAAEIGHVGFFHLRYSDPDPPGTSLEALEEVLGIGRRTGCSLHIQHLTSTGGTFVMDEALNAIEAARGERVDVTACVYPYSFWGTYLASPRFDEGWQQRYRITTNELQIAGTSQRLASDTWDQAVAKNYLVAALGSIPEEEVRAALLRPWVMVASDAIPTEGLNNHPRGAGTFARTIGRYVRETGVLDLRTGLAKMTILPALRVQSMIPAMALKGRLQRGADADVVVFDPLAIMDKATVDHPGEPSVGIEWVIVDGQVALRRGRTQRSVLAGRPLRSRPLG